MSRISVTPILRTTTRSTRFIGSHLLRKETRPLVVCSHQRKQAEVSVICLDAPLDIVSRRSAQPLALLSSELHPHWSIHHPNSWNWTSADIIAYLERWCSNPPDDIENKIDRQELRQLYNRIVRPSCERGTPFVAGTTPLIYLTVGHGRGSCIPITEFYTAMGWIISKVESRGPQPLDYCKVLATYAKWSHTIWKDLFPGTCVPTTASIKVVTLPSQMYHGSARHSFWVSTSLPHANLKEEARLIREKYMHNLFGQLPDAPIYIEAIKQGEECGRIKWGHCAETLTTMCSYFHVPLPGFICGVTIKLKPVAKAPKYMPVVFRNAALEACDNCKIMMKHAKIAYNDWYHQGISPKAVIYPCLVPIYKPPACSCVLVSTHPSAKHWTFGHTDHGHLARMAEQLLARSIGHTME